MFSVRTNRMLLLAMTIALPCLLAIVVRGLMHRHSAARSVDNRPPLSTWDLVNNTAQGVALARYLATKENNPALALSPSSRVMLEILLPNELLVLADLTPARETMKDAMLGHMYNTVLARTHFIDDTLQETILSRNITARGKETTDEVSPAIEQLVIIGAGFDERAFKYWPLLQANNISVFEVDVPSIQRDKQAALQQAIHEQRKCMHQPGDIEAAYNNIQFVPCNLTQVLQQQNLSTITGNQTMGVDSGAEILAPLWTALVEAGYNESLPSLFIMEGLLHYLPPVAVNGTLRSIHHHSAPTSVIIFDYIAPDPTCADSAEYTSVLEAVAGLGEPIQFVIELPVVIDTNATILTENATEEQERKHQHKQQLRAFLSHHGLTLMDVMDADDLEEMLVIRAQPETGETVVEVAAAPAAAPSPVYCAERIATARNKPIEIDVEAVGRTPAPVAVKVVEAVDESGTAVPVAVEVKAPVD